MKRFLTGCMLVLGLALPARAEDRTAAAPKTFAVPYRLTVPKHILVRAKINRQGPFNFILDTGAPALFVATATCKKLGIEPDANGWGTFKRFEIEGGAILANVKGRVEDPFQLEGMNGLGLAGAELHGIIGYNVLARYRMEIDFTKDKMRWTALDFEPQVPRGLSAKGGGAGGLEVIGTILKMLGGLLGKKAAPEVVGRGSFGIELEDGAEMPAVKSVLRDGPAGKAGIEAGDRISHVQGRGVVNTEDVLRLARRIRAGDPITFTIQRGGASREIQFKAGEGL